MTNPNILELVDIFASLKPEHLEQIIKICEPLSYKLHEVIFEEGSPSNDFYIILEGKVEIQIDQETRRDANKPPPRVRIAVLFRGQSFGEVALVDLGLRSASAVCGSQSCTLLRIRRKDFMELLHSDKEMGFIVMTNLAADLCTKIRNTNYLAREALLYGLKPA